MTAILFALVVGLVASLVATPTVRMIARKVGMVAKPRADRWHKKPTALMGGVGIFVAFAANVGVQAWRHNMSQGGLLIACATMMFVLGFVDDLVQLKPYTKLVVQLLAAVILTSYGMTLHWTPWAPVNHALTVFWLVGITNALNLLDNIDGLAGGIAAIGGGFTVYFLYQLGLPSEAAVMAGFVGALIGFLVFNFNPASIFMGDSGSLFIGFYLGGSALWQNQHAPSSSNLVSVLALPILILAIPILDTTLVTVTRKLAGRPVSQGGRDHASHRLVALGLSERAATLTLYGVALLSGAVAVLAWHSSASIAVAVLPVFVFAVAILAVYLGRVKVYEPAATAPEGRATIPTLADFAYKRRMFEVLSDFALILLAYYSAFLLRFEGALPEQHWQKLMLSMPIVAGSQITIFLVTGLYAGLWRYTGMSDLRRIVVSTFAASVGSVLCVLLAFRGLAGFSRTVFILDGMLLFFGVAGTRVSFRMLRDTLVGRRSSQKRVLIYGAGDAGELLVREMKNNLLLNLKPVGFIDDDPRKVGALIHGLRVLGTSENLDQLITSNSVDELVLSTNHLESERLTGLDLVCRDREVRLRRARIELH
jgi:UDP-GlcNAc:undecaprenyl-phosphate/decaprenyl-phosphate GlcNAc-1-phosphate transferase